MERFEFYNAKPFTLIPRIQYMYAGYNGLDNGLCIVWLNKVFVIVRPINQRV